jgi:peptidoglycan/LPS O-acetylase OafA/YrhL
MVLAIHLGPVYITVGGSLDILNWLFFKTWVMGGYGVSLFFVVSGYLITSRLAHSTDGLFHPNYRDFYSRRFGRIVPLLLLTCVMGLLMVCFAHEDSQRFHYCIKNEKVTFSPWMWLAILLFVFNWYRSWLGAHPGLSSPYLGLHWDVLWSLSIEEQFYLFYPVLLKKLRRTRNLVLFLLGVILTNQSVLVWRALRPYRYSPPSWSSFSGFMLIAIGCLLYLANAHYGKRLRANPGFCRKLVISGFIIFFWAYLHSQAKVYVLYRAFGDLLIGGGAALFILGALHIEIFNSKYLYFLTLPGQMSYGVYLLHPIVLFFLWPFLSGKNSIMAFSVLVVSTTVVALISYRYYEEPMNRWIRSLARPRDGGGQRDRVYGNAMATKE